MAQQPFIGADPFRPRDAFDEGVDPATLRGMALRLMDDTARLMAELDAAIARLPWYRRIPIRLTLRALKAWAWVSVFAQRHGVD